MVSTISAVLGISAISAYLAGAIVQVRGFAARKPANGKLLLVLAACGLFAHALANFRGIFLGDEINLGLVNAASFVMWILLAAVLLTSIRLPVHSLLVLILPVAAVSVIAELIWAGSRSRTVPLAQLDAPLVAHIFLSLAAYSVLFMAACQSILLAFLEHRLRTKQTLPQLRSLPPLETIESLLFGLVWVGFVALSLAIASGFVFLDDMFARGMVHHTVLAIASWFVYAVLLTGHHVLGWRGATAVRWTLTAFVLLLLGYFGTKFVVEILLEH